MSEQITREQRPVEFQLMDELNSLTKHRDAGTPLGPVQFVYDKKVWWIVCPTTGYGYYYPSLREAVRRWHVTVIGYDHGAWAAIPDAQTPERTLETLYARVFRPRDHFA